MQRLSPRRAIAVLLGAVVLGGPAAYMVETSWGPAGWLLDLQDRTLGGHFPVSTAAIIMLAEILALSAVVGLLGVVIRALTGKTIVQLVGRRP